MLTSYCVQKEIFRLYCATIWNWLIAFHDTFVYNLLHFMTRLFMIDCILIRFYTIYCTLWYVGVQLIAFYDLLHFMSGLCMIDYILLCSCKMSCTSWHVCVHFIALLACLRTIIASYDTFGYHLLHFMTPFVYNLLHIGHVCLQFYDCILWYICVRFIALYDMFVFDLLHFIKQ